MKTSHLAGILLALGLARGQGTVAVDNESELTWEFQPAHPVQIFAPNMREEDKSATVTLNAPREFVAKLEVFKRLVDGEQPVQLVNLDTDTTASRALSSSGTTDIISRQQLDRFSVINDQVDTHVKVSVSTVLIAETLGSNVFFFKVTAREGMDGIRPGEELTGDSFAVSDARTADEIQNDTALTPFLAELRNENAEGGENDGTAEGDETLINSSVSSGTAPQAPTLDSIPTGGSAGEPDAQSPSTSQGSSRLSPGAIAGIAVGGFILVVVIPGLVWLLLRKRKRTAAAHQADASTPLAAGYPNAAAGRSGDFIPEKEAGAMVAESPHSQIYSDREPRPSQSMVMAGAAPAGATAGAGAGYAESSHQPYGSPIEQPPTRREESSRAGMDSPVPSMTVARHLVDPNMTEDEIRRLEEEERELDREIQEAGRRR